MSILSEIERRRLKNPDQLAVVHHLGRGKTARLSYEELGHRSDELASFLAERGLASGSFAGLTMRRSVEHVVAMIAVLKTGAAFFSLNPKLPLEQVAHAANLCSAPLLLLDNAALIKCARIDPERFADTRFVRYDDGDLSPAHHAIQRKLAGKIALEDFTNEGLPETQAEASVDKDGAAVALFTSGSTGRPKGVMISHRDLVNRVRTEVRDYRLTPSDRLLSLLPFSFDVGLNQLYSSLASGATLVILNSWLAPDVCAVVEEQSISCVSAVPSIWREFMAHDEPSVRDCFKRLRYITISGGDMSSGELRRLRDLAPETDIFKTYGQTEAFRGGMLRPDEFESKMTTVGRPVDGTDVFILTEDGRKAEPNEEGEVIFSGDGMMMRYVGDAQGTAEKIKRSPFSNEPVVFTGDNGRIDADGYLTLLGRRDKMLKVKGNRVYPKEIQDRLAEHDAVVEAAVFGVDADGDKKLIAQVRFKDGAEISELEMKMFLAQRLASYMVPARVVEVDDFPRTQSGKIMFAQLEADYREQR